MKLIDQQKQERRDRILAAARRLAADKGFDRLTMRELAAASRVSVPTLYSLFGSKDAILMADVERTVGILLASFDAPANDMFDRIVAIYNAGARVVTAMPDYYGQLLRVLATSPEAGGTRAQVEARFIDMMAAVLRDGQRDGLVAAWIDPAALSAQMWSHYVMALARWALGELPAEHFLDATLYGMSLTLLGLARGSAADQLAECARRTQPHAFARPRRDSTEEVA